MIYNMPELSIIDSIGSLREIHLSDVTIDYDGLCNIINTKFPILESLTLDIMWCGVEILDIRSNSLQRLKILLRPFRTLTEIQVNAPKLLSFQYKGCAMPSLLFPTIAPEQLELTLMVNRPIDHLVFLKLREYLNLSSKFNIVIRSLEDYVLSFNIDNVRTRVLFLATNVEKLSIESFEEDGLVENSVLLFDTLFSICQPLYVEAHLQMRLKAADYFLKLIDMGVTENKSGHWPGLKCCEIRNGLKGEWETLTGSSLSLVGEWSQCVFKLAYCSP